MMTRRQIEFSYGGNEKEDSFDYTGKLVKIASQAGYLIGRVKNMGSERVVLLPFISYEPFFKSYGKDIPYYREETKIPAEIRFVPGMLIIPVSDEYIKRLLEINKHYSDEH
jgi:hypothetical protein